METDVIVVIVVATALAFDFTNGFHDTANVVATSISTRAMAPRIAVAYAAILNFVGAFISLEVAATVAKDVVDPAAISLLAIFAGLVGAIAWNLDHLVLRPAVELVARPHRRASWAPCWCRPGPTRSTSNGILGKVVIPAFVAPILAFAVGGHRRSCCSTGSSASMRPARATRGFRVGQVMSGGLLALAHGTNDAQKTMGVITLALVANGTIASNDFHVPDWVVVTSATAISLGTYVGGWRIIKTMGSRIHKMDSAQGFAAQGSGAAVILASSHVGFPLSTTQTISGRGDRLGRRQAPLGRALGRGREHRRRVDHHAPRLGGDRCLHVRRDPDVRHGRRRPDRRVRADTGRRGAAARSVAHSRGRRPRCRPRRDPRDHRRRRPLGGGVDRRGGGRGGHRRLRRRASRHRSRGRVRARRPPARGHGLRRAGGARAARWWPPRSCSASS